MSESITLTVDYHDETCVVRRRDGRTHREQSLSVPTTADALEQLLEQALADGKAHCQRVVWIQESTTGWARVQKLLGGRAEFVLANVLQMPRPPKGHRRKTDKVDTERLQREYLNGKLPRAATPGASWRQLRRLVALREDLVRRRTMLRCWIDRYLAHETWADRSGLWTSSKGAKRFQKILTTLPSSDQQVIKWKREELELLGRQLDAVEARFAEVHRDCPEARRLDAIRGIGVVASVSIVARIGPIERFADAEALIAYAGLAPGVQQSDQTRRYGRVGGGGTDTRLRHYVIEATLWARQLPRYRRTYQRVAKRRGNKIGRLVVARMLLRGIYKVLRDGVEFDGEGAAGRREPAVRP